MTLLKYYMKRYHCGRRVARYWLHQFRWKVKEYKSFLKAENGNKAKQIAIENYRRACTNMRLKQEEISKLQREMEVSMFDRYGVKKGDFENEKI